MTRLHWTEPGHDDLHVQLRGPSTSKTTPVVFLPGFDLDDQWGFYPHLIEQLAQSRPVLLPSLPKPYSLSSERSHVAQVLETLSKGTLPEGCDWNTGKVGLIGHGKGAALALLLAAEEDAVKGVVALSSYCTFNRGHGISQSTVQADANQDVKEDVAANAASFQLEVAARSLRCPVVFVHGEEDAISSFIEAETLYHWVPKDLGSLVLLEKTGHSLGATHPFTGSGKELERTIKIARDFFARELD